ncbi:MAG: SO_0444 family Cu/Zn efflux transporter [Planctomycetota bacterium]|nr:SO_0444 family Cu/Zn efflux transporter [Planctomycetota bacterium]
MEFLLDWWLAIWGILAESGPWLMVGFLIAGILKIFIPQEGVFRHFGGNDFRSVLKASLFGAPLPLCSCSVIPTAASLRDSGASKGATTSFLIATPETGVDSIGITWALFDPLMTILRPIAAILTAILSGTFVNRLVLAKADNKGFEEVAKPDTKPDWCAHKQTDAVAKVHPPLGERLIASLRFSFGKLMEDLTPWFLLGFLLSGGITVMVPENFFGDTIPSGFVAMLIMLVLSMPMYICATASTPVAAALVLKGMDPGAALVLLLAGPATNITTMLVVRNFLGTAVLRVYLISLIVVSLTLGWLVNLLYESMDIDLSTAIPHVHEMEHDWLATAGGLVLSALLLFHSWRLWIAPRFR